MTKRKEDLDIHQLLKLGRKKASETLPIFIVEDHNEALSAIYKAIRRRLLAMSNISMLHFDSHPDLSVPKYIRPELIFEDPEETLHLLRNSESGIADWIIPLIYGGHLNRIIWVKPPWSDQIKNGKYKFSVGSTIKYNKDGNNNGIERLHVSCNEPYWKDESVFMIESKLNNKQSVQLDVLSLPFKQDTIISKTTWSNYVLDVCLDYFATDNPFWNELELKCTENELKIVKKMYKYISNIIHKKSVQSTTIKEQNADNSINNNLKSMNQENKRKVIDIFLAKESRDKSPIACFFNDEVFKNYDQLKENGNIKQFLNNFSHLLLQETNNNNNVNNIDNKNSNSCNKKKDDVKSSLINNFLNTLKQFCKLLCKMEKKDVEMLEEYLPMLGLPKNKTTREEMLNMFNEFETCLSKTLNICGKPKLVTIACSAADMFTPANDVHWILSNVIKKIKCVFGCNVDLIFDDDVELSL